MTQEGLDIGGYTQGIELFLKELTGPAGALDSWNNWTRWGSRRCSAKATRAYTGSPSRFCRVCGDYMTVAPAHNGPYLEAIGVFQQLLPGTPLVGAFETAFHRTIPLYRRLYALPWAWSQAYGLEKMGFHGASHSYVALKTGGKGRVVSCHLGGSSSLCAILDGKSVDNSFGLSLQTGIPPQQPGGGFGPLRADVFAGPGHELGGTEPGPHQGGGAEGRIGAQRGHAGHPKGHGGGRPAGPTGL